MKKLILILFFSLFSLSSYAAPANSIDIDGLSVYPLNPVQTNNLTVYGHTSGAISAGICRIIIRSAHGEDGFADLAKRFKFTQSLGGMPGQEVAPIVKRYALMFKLMKVDYGFENVLIETKDGKSIGENIKAVFGDTPVAVIAGTCY